MSYPNERGIRHGVNPVPGSGTYGESPASGPAPTTAGHHKHDLLNKLDPRVNSTQDRLPVSSTGTHAPHSSRLANALDPRVDNSGAAPPAAPAMHGAMGTRHAVPEAPEGTYGPHRSRVANALDPRVDSDADHRHNMHQPAVGHGHLPTGAAAAGAAAPGYGPGTGAGAAAGMGIGTGNHSGRHHHQPHHQGPAGMGPGMGMNETGVGYPTTGLPGPAPNTAGPHRSDWLNRLDPRVDSKTGERRDERPYQEGRYTERRGI